MAKQRALHTVCKGYKTHRHLLFRHLCELTIVQIALDGDSTLAIHMQQESIPSHSAMIHLEEASPTPSPASECVSRVQILSLSLSSL